MNALAYAGYSRPNWWHSAGYIRLVRLGRYSVDSVFTIVLHRCSSPRVDDIDSRSRLRHRLKIRRQTRMAYNITDTRDHRDGNRRHAGRSRRIAWTHLKTDHNKTTMRTDTISRKTV